MSTQEQCEYDNKGLPSSKYKCVSGWYDTYVGIQGETFTLREFFNRTGITLTDCRKAFEK